MARAGPKKKGKEKSKRLTPAEQHARFVETAKQAEADDSADAMDKAFKRLKVNRKSPSTP